MRDITMLLDYNDIDDDIRDTETGDITQGFLEKYEKLGRN